MTVLGLKLSRRANAVSALHGEVSRAMWTGLYPGQARRRSSHRAHHQRRACSVLAGAADVPPLRPPSWDRLARAQRRSPHLGGHRERRRRRTVGNPSQPEIAAAGIRAAPRGGAGRAPRRVAGDAAAAGPGAESGRADHRVCAPLRDLQAGRPDSGRHRKAGLHGERSQAPGAVRFRRQGASPRRTRQAGAAADRGVDARHGSLPTSSSSSKTTTSTSAAISCRASMSG